MVLDASEADFYPIQPSFSAGYTVTAQKLNSATADWAYVISGDFPYSQWMAWYLYDTKGVPLFKFSDSGHQGRRRVDEPVRRRQQGARARSAATTST